MANVSASRLTEQKIAPGVYAGVLEFDVLEGALTAAATTEALTIPGFPSDAIPLHAEIAIGTFFTGGSATAVTAQIGDSGDPNGLLAALNVFDTTSLGDWTVGTLGVEAEYGSTGPALESAYAPEILFTATTDDVADLTAGKLSGRIYYKRYDGNS
jgi:hypothetical protein